MISPVLPPPFRSGVIMLRSLKMYGMAGGPEAWLRRDAVTDLTDRAMETPLVRVTMARGAPAFEAAVPILSQ